MTLRGFRQRYAIRHRSGIDDSEWSETRMHLHALGGPVSRLHDGVGIPVHTADGCGLEELIRRRRDSCWKRSCTDP